MGLKKFFGYSGWAILNISVFISGFLFQKDNPGLSTLNKLGISVYTSRGAGMCLAFLPGLLILTMCRHTFTYISKKITILKEIRPVLLHKIISYTMVFWSFVHSIAHFVNFYNVEKILNLTTTYNLHFKMIGGVTGHVMLQCIIFITMTSLIKNKIKFEYFWYPHHLFLIFYCAYLFHGTGCFVKTNENKCVPYYSSLVSIPFFILYLIERLAREFKGEAIIKKITFSNDIIKIYLKKNIEYFPGQYVLVKCDNVSKIEWHPFTLTSCPSEEEILICIKCLGDWTMQLREKILSKEELSIKIDGGFCSPIDKVERYKSIILIASGIGITPFISILKGISMQDGEFLKKIDLIWINRSDKDFESFNEELDYFWKEHLNIKFNMYNTNKTTGIEKINNIADSFKRNKPVKIYKTDIPIRYGRPNFDVFFKNYIKDNDQMEVGVFVCGGTELQKIVRKSCETYSNKDVYFDYNSEKFS